MIHIQKLSECHLIKNPELQREVTSYLLYCQYELQEYADEHDSDLKNFSFSVFQESDLPAANGILNNLDSPEETAQISIKADGITQTIYRIVYPTEVLFIPSDISDQISF